MTSRRQKLVAARLALALCLAAGLGSCSYLKYASVQREYKRIQNAEPSQLVARHMIDRETFFITGRAIDERHVYTGIRKAVAAFSSRYQPHEWVDTMFFEVSGSHYGLNLPEGHHDLLVLADVDSNGVFEEDEVVARRSLELDLTAVPGMVLSQLDLVVGEVETVDWPIAIDAPDIHGRVESLFYPSGTIRTLDDPIFDKSFSTLGMYDPASFISQAPTAFYALEEDLAYKIPVVFVHGIGGSAREFAPLVARLDRSRYKPWFYHYASGGDLDQLAELFYEIFLSGKVYPANEMPMIVVAHSMGGLIAREAINRYSDKSRENQVHLLVTIASPFGGHAAARSGEEHGLLVLPSWRDLNPDNRFVRELFRKPLPEFVHHELVYAYQNPGTIKIGENSDGVVPLSSQLDPRVQRQADGQFGFNNTHTDILQSEDVAAHILALLDRVENFFPAEQLGLLRQGGYGVPLGDEYSAITQYTIRNYGKYLMALTRGDVTLFHPNEEDFIAMINGERPPRNEEEEGWLRFLADYPELLRDEP